MPAGKPRYAGLRISGVEVRRDQYVTLVRYYPTRDGWAHEFACGLFAGRAEDNRVRLVDGDTLLLLDETVWQLCLTDFEAVA